MEPVSYAVPGGFQGSCERLRVVGNKSGQEVPLVWEINPLVFDELEAVAGVPVKLLHVYRNPWDNIASMARVQGDTAARRYFRRARLIRKFKFEAVRPVLDVKLEVFAAEPRRVLRAIFGFYGLAAPNRLVRACASIVDPVPNPSRRLREWPADEVREIAQTMQGFEWMRGYPDRPD
jgi:hypothetical protein